MSTFCIKKILLMWEKVNKTFKKYTKAVTFVQFSKISLFFFSLSLFLVVVDDMVFVQHLLMCQLFFNLVSFIMQVSFTVFN